MSKNIREFVPEGKTFEQAISRETAVVEERKPEPEVKPVEKPVEQPKPDEEFNLDARIDLKTPEKPEEKPVEQQKPKKNEAIREQLTKVVEERDAERKRLAEVEAERQRILKEHEEFKKNADERFKELEQIKANATVGDPANHPEVRKIADPWNSSAKEFASDMADLTGGEADGIFAMILGASKQISELEPSSDEYRAAMAGIRTKLSTELGEGGLLQGMKMVREGAGAINQIKSVVNEIKSDLPKFRFKQEAEFYGRAKSDYDKIEANLFNPSPETREADPLNQSVVLRAMIDGSPEVKQAAEAIKSFARFAILPPPPIAPDDLEGLDESARSQKILSIHDRHRKANEKLRGVIAEALLARQVLPSLWKRVSELEDALAGERRAIRGRPQPSMEEPARADKTVGIEQFQPVNAELDDFRKGA